MAIYSCVSASLRSVAVRGYTVRAGAAGCPSTYTLYPEAASRGAGFVCVRLPKPQQQLLRVGGPESRRLPAVAGKPYSCCGQDVSLQSLHSIGRTEGHSVRKCKAILVIILITNCQYVSGQSGTQQ